MIQLTFRFPLSLPEISNKFIWFFHLPLNSSKMFQLALMFFQVCGFYPAETNVLKSHSKHPKSRKFLKKISLGVWPSINFIVVLSLIFYMAINNDDLLYSATPIGKINDILVYFSLVFANLSIIVESGVKRKYFSYFWTYYESLNRIESRPRKRKWQKRLEVNIILFFLFSFSTEIVVISNIGLDVQWTNFWYSTVFSLLMTRNRHLQHIFFIDIIFFTLEDMNSHLRSSIAWTKASGVDRSFGQKFLYKEVSRMKEKFKNLMEMLICVNRIFCWSQVLNLAQHFIEVTSELYWVYAFSISPEFLWRELKLFHLKFSNLTENIFSNFNCLCTNNISVCDVAQFSNKVH